MNILAVLEEDGLPDEDICLIPYDDVALLTLLLTLINLLYEAGDEMHIEGMLEPYDEAKALKAEIIE